MVDPVNRAILESLQAALHAESAELAAALEASFHEEAPRRGPAVDCWRKLATVAYCEGAVPGTDCVACSEDFEPGEELLQLPGCKHAFHALCISQWPAPARVPGLP